jgi:diaminopropionate ammonia-lyase
VPTKTFDWYARPAARGWRCPPADDAVSAFHSGLPGYAPTPLRELPGLADELGVGRVFVKDETSRLGLPSFKILGASWAVHKALTPGGKVRLVTATDGNHGRAVARTARLLGLSALVFVPDCLHPAAVAAIEGEGAEVRSIDGSYDEAVRIAATAGGLLIQDTAWPGYEQIPGWIVEGYSTLFREIDAQLDAAGSGPAGLVAVPVGVGSLAQAAVTHYRSNGKSPALLSVEPTAAACLLESLRAGEIRTIVTEETLMTGLTCGTPSGGAWPHLAEGVDAAVAVTDAEAVRAVRDLAALDVDCGPCGAAALAGTRAALSDDHRRSQLGVGPADTVVLLCTEGSAANPVVNL